MQPRNLPSLWKLMASAAAVLAQHDQPAEATELLSAAVALPFGDSPLDVRMQTTHRTLADLQSRLSPAAFESAWARGKRAAVLPIVGHMPGRFPHPVARRVHVMLDLDCMPEQTVLTEREFEVLDCLARGCSNEEIADELVLSVSTVKRHVHHIYTKLGVRNRVEAVARSRELGLL